MKKQTFLVILSFALVFVLLMSGSHIVPSNYEHNLLSAFENSTVSKVTITAYRLNVRSGASTQFSVIRVLDQGQTVDVIGKIGGWYVIHTNDDLIGAISSRYTKPAVPSTEGNVSPTRVQNLSYEQSRMLQLVNEERGKAGVKPLVWDSDVARVAKYKAIDMVNNDYFDHTSPTYGSPFDMMKSFGIQYQAAGENLAGYNDVDKAHAGLMNSDGHRRNILNPSFTHIGIGVTNSPRYGYIFVQMFVGR